MIKIHPNIEAAPDNAIIWRYMGLPSYLALLENRSLYFTRLDKFRDVYEGTPAAYNETEWQQRYEIEDCDLESVSEMFRENGLVLRKQIFASCWHLNSVESAAMWDLYVKAGEGIAIKTTVGALRSSFIGTSTPSYIGNVKYLDYNNEWMPEGNSFFPMFYKRLSFNHEQELRVIYRDGTVPYYVKSESPEVGKNF